MKKRANVPNYAELDNETSWQVRQRDKDICLLCGDRFQDIHEIIPRRELGSRMVHILFHPMNRVCLCRKCHAGAGSKRKELVNMLYEKYNYDYMKYSIYIKYLIGEDEE